MLTNKNNLYLKIYINYLQFGSVATLFAQLFPKVAYLPSQSTSSMHLLHPLQPSLHITQPAALMLQHPWIVLRQQDHDFMQQ
jgi:hypothetical protein